MQRDCTTNPGGIEAISRWLSEATPPVSINIISMHPEGMPAILCAENFAMGSTYLALHYHLVFSTKHRQPLIAPEWQPRLHEYLGGAVNGLGGYSQGVGGVADHVHLLVGLKSTHCLADFMRELKKSSSILGA